jgi:hypothetical protein
MTFGRIGTIEGWDTEAASDPLAVVRFDGDAETWLVTPDMLDEVPTN